MPSQRCIACSRCQRHIERAGACRYDPHGEPPRGEICLRGPLVFKGYYQDEKKTKEAFDEEGFFHSGKCLFAKEVP